MSDVNRSQKSKTRHKNAGRREKSLGVWEFNSFEELPSVTISFFLCLVRVYHTFFARSFTQDLSLPAIPAQHK